jgi:hypothetical protein
VHDTNRRRNPTTERSMDTNLSDPRPLLLEIGVQVLVATSGLDSEVGEASQGGGEKQENG